MDIVITLTAMPATVKRVKGLLSKKTGKKVAFGNKLNIDVDKWIKEKTGMTAAKFFRVITPYVPEIPK